MENKMEHEKEKKKKIFNTPRHLPEASGDTVVTSGCGHSVLCVACSR